ncbi:hypothetical protein KC331_g6172 [Hortaea werneckii]|nr:hypothetical protein KC331_g6172 [Hortaea werneckii]KAI7715971.1 hypothetical protein KC353_g5709 [Hortaea werneckii]
MNILLLLFVLLGIFLTLLLAFFALSSCLGDEIRAVWFQQGRRQGSRSAAPPTTYGLQYARFMGGGAAGGDVHASSGWEGIEMQDLLDKRFGGGRAEEEED